MIEVHWAGERWIASADGALWWPRRRTLCIADLHLGKPAAFRSAGVPVPESTTTADLQRLSRVIERHRPDRLAILGDLIHARSGRVAATLETVATWRRSHWELDVLLVRGNHDRSAGDPPLAWNARIVDEPHEEIEDGSVALAHDPERFLAASSNGHALCGHLHPAVVLHGALKSTRASCFWFRERVAVLPAFGSFTGSKSVRPARADRVLAIHGEEIADVSSRNAHVSSDSARRD